MCPQGPDDVGISSYSYREHAFKPFRRRAVRRWNSKARNADDGLHFKELRFAADLHNATALSRVGPGNGPRGTKERPRRGPYRREDDDQQDDVYEF